MDFRRARLATCSLLWFLPVFSHTAVLTNCSEGALREAIAGGGLVQFSCDGVIQLSNTLDIWNEVVLDGSGQNVIISGNTNARVFEVFSGAKLTLKQLTIANGRHAPAIGDATGGGLRNNGGIVVFEDVVFTNNVAKAADGRSNPIFYSAFGGAVFNTNGQISGTRVAFINNLARGGRAVNGTDGCGGAIANRSGTVCLTNVAFTGNTAMGGDAFLPSSFDNGTGEGSGGALFSDGGNVFVQRSIFSNNAARSGLPDAASGPAYSAGGAIFVGGGMASFYVCEFRTNSAFASSREGSAAGGAVFNAGSIWVRDCTFRQNNARMLLHWSVGINASARSEGGGLFNSGTSVVEGSVFCNNTADGPVNMTSHAYGGAIYNASNLLAVTNCTFTSNRATGGDLPDISFCGYAAGDGYGGGIHIQDGMAIFTSVTLSQNGAFAGRPHQASCSNSFGRSFGGNISRAGGSVILKNSIVANSSGSSNAFGSLLDAGNNLSSDSSCAFTNIGSRNGVDPKLGPLDHYGGESLTLPLLTDSPALDTGSNVGVPIDQRGRARPFGAAPDIGAFESSPPYVLRGSVSGYLPPTGATVRANETHSLVAAGKFSFENVTPGSYAVSLSASNTVFAPFIQFRNIGPDQVGVHFHGYQSNALAIGLVSPVLQRIVFAAQPGASAQVLVSTNLIQWSPVWSNSIPPDGLATFDENVSVGSRRFFKASRP